MPLAPKTLRRPIARINRPLSTSTDKASGELAAGHQPLASIARKKVGLLGGSFNPAHQGHRAISLEALRRLALDEVWWLVSPQNPLKSANDMASFDARMAYAKTIVAGDPRLVVTNLEQTFGTQYTVDTIERLRRDGHVDFVWLIGADNLVQMPKWRSWRTLLDLVPIAVFDREPYSYRALAGRVARAYAAHRLPERDASWLARADPPAWVYLRLRRHHVSSTSIRQQGRWPNGSWPTPKALTEGGLREGQSS